MAILHLHSMKRHNSALLPVECECGMITLTKISSTEDYPKFVCVCGSIIDVDKELDLFLLPTQNFGKTGS